LLIVLVLHVVAVSGIIAFNAIKTRQNSSPPPVRTASSPNLAATSAVKPDTVTPHPAAAGPKEAARHDELKPSHSPPKQVAAKDEHKAEHIKSSTPASGDSGKVYVVVKGDNPVTIAKKLKVSYDELLALNHIEDPRKLQIGQKLLIPNKMNSKKTEE
jgi:LysM repeat protein